NPQNQPHPTPSDGLIPVTIGGVVASTGAPAPQLSFVVTDELGRVFRRGTLSTTIPAFEPGGVQFRTFLTGPARRVGLPLARLPPDPDGRQFTITVTARDGNDVATATTVVTVPLKVFPFIRNPQIKHPQ